MHAALLPIDYDWSQIGLENGSIKLTSIRVGTETGRETPEFRMITGEITSKGVMRQTTVITQLQEAGRNRPIVSSRSCRLNGLVKYPLAPTSQLSLLLSSWPMPVSITTGIDLVALSLLI